jgi:hypothetical protein
MLLAGKLWGLDLGMEGFEATQKSDSWRSEVFVDRATQALPLL